MSYPTKKIIDEFYSYLLSFANDLAYIEDILIKLDDWNERGIDVVNSIEQLIKQVEDWKNAMNDLIDHFKNNILTLKERDNTTDTNNNLDFNVTCETYDAKWKHLYSIYCNIFHNLNSGIDILNNNDIDKNQEQELDVNPDNFKTSIDNQINDLQIAILNSLNELDHIIDSIKDYSTKILPDEEELTDEEELIGNNYLAIYSKIGVDAMNFLLYFDMNTQINYDSVVDGTNVLNHVKKKLISTNSPMYDESKDSSHYETDFTKPYKWLYYGFDKDNMIKAKIVNYTYRTSYQDEHDNQRIINTFYDRSTDHVKKMVELFESNNLVYNIGSKSTEKLYIVYSMKEITDFSNLTFIGEN